MNDNQTESELKQTFDEMLVIEPRLEQLRREAIGYMANSPGEYWKRSRFWYHELKPRFIRLVGFIAEKSELQTTEAYEAAYMGFVRILRI